MGASPTRAVTHQRSKPRAYLLLSRISNLPTVWSNVAAGWSVSAGGFTGASTGRIAAISAAVSTMYVAGMFLNDAFDAGFDRAHRPDRPLPSGNVTIREAYAIGGGLLAAGTGALAASGIQPLLYGVVLAATIVYYDYRHKGFALGPVVMGVCRGLVYCIAASAAAGVSARVYAAALLLTLYTSSLTVVAKQTGRRAAAVVPLMIAGMSLVDAAVILWSGGGSVALVGPICFALTLALQRVVPGT
jgi:4-hydroxybenzoate polyprenyltransferase